MPRGFAPDARMESAALVIAGPMYGWNCRRMAAEEAVRKSMPLHVLPSGHAVIAIELCHGSWPQKTSTFALSTLQYRKKLNVNRNRPSGRSSPGGTGPKDLASRMAFMAVSSSTNESLGRQTR